MKYKVLSFFLILSLLVMSPFSAIVNAETQAVNSVDFFKYSKKVSINPGYLGFYGKVVDLSPDGLWSVVGAPDENSAKGNVYVYKYQTGQYVYKQTLNRPVANNSRFGDKLSITNDTLAVSSKGLGLVYIYRLVNGSW